MRPESRKADPRGHRPQGGRGSVGPSPSIGAFEVAGWSFIGSALDLDFQNNLAALNQYPVGLATSRLSITRATSGYAQSTSTGLWTSFASGQFRQTDKGLLVEEARTNSLLWCRDMTNAAWTLGATMTRALNQVGIDGSANSATLLTGGAVTATNTILQTITLGSATDTYSVWLKRSNGSGTIEITPDGTTWTSVTLTTSFQQFQVTQAAVVNPVCGIRITTNGDAVVADFNQLESAASYATSPILTTTVAVTRNADIVTLTSTGPLSPILGTIFIEFLDVVGPVSITRRPFVMQLDSNNDISIFVNSTNILRGSTFTGGVLQTNIAASNAEVANTVYRLAYAYQTNDFAAAFSSSLAAAVGTDSSGSVWSGAFTAQIGGYPSVSQYVDGYVRRLAWFPGRIGNPQLLSWAQGTVGP